MNVFRSLIVMLLAVSVGFAQKLAPIPKPTGYVDDFAQVLTPDGKADIDEICHEVHQKAKAQIFFVTIKSLRGEPIENYSNDLFHQWKIGEKKTDRGILVLLSIDDHKRRIEVGYGLEGILPDAKAGDIGRDMVPALQQSNYDEAARISVTEIASTIAADAKVQLTTVREISDSPAPPPVAAAPPSSGSQGAPGWAIAVLLICFFGIFGLILWAIIRRARGGGGGPGFYDSGSSMGSTSFGGSGGGDSGGSDSFSGGDGGDSGGGGASGDW